MLPQRYTVLHLQITTKIKAGCNSKIDGYYSLAPAVNLQSGYIVSHRIVESNTTHEIDPTSFSYTLIKSL